MRILQVSYTYPPFLEMGGPPVKVRAIAEGLVARGHDVTVLTANYGRPSGTHTRRVGGVEIVYLRTAARYRVTTLNPGAIGFCRRRMSAFDAVHIYGLYDLLGPIAGRYAARLGVPYVLEPLGMFRPIVRSLGKKRAYHALLGGRLVRDASSVIATSEQERFELLEGGIPQSKVVLRRNGIDLREFERLPPTGKFRARWGIAPEEPVTTFLGRLAIKKRTEMLVSAFASTAKGRLVFAGPDEDGTTDRLIQAAERLGIRDRLVFTGAIYGEDKVSALADTDVFVLPSESENFGNSVAEAMACGTAVIVTDRCGIAPYVNDRAGLVVRLDEEDLSRALENLLSDPGLRQRFASQGPEVAKELSWDEPIDETEALYEELSRPGAGSSS